MKRTIRLNESELKRMIGESLKGLINELDWKTYANAARKRLQQYRDDPSQKDKWEKYYDLSQTANQRFNDEYIGNMKYDTFGDKWKGKHSPKFDGKMDLSKNDRMPYGAINGYNKGGNKLFSVEKDKYYGPHGYTNPSTFFKDKEVADKFKTANDELWDYDNDNYEYTKGEGWKLKNMVSESVKKVLKEGHWDSNVYDMWEKVREMVGDDTMLLELYNYMSGDDIEDFIYDHMDRNYDLGLRNEEEDDEY